MNPQLKEESFSRETTKSYSISAKSPETLEDAALLLSVLKDKIRRIRINEKKKVAIFNLHERISDKNEFFGYRKEIQDIIKETQHINDYNVIIECKVVEYRTKKKPK